MLFSGKIPAHVAARLTPRFWVLHLLRFATIRDCSPLFALFETIRTIHTMSLFAIRDYSRLFAIHYSGFPDTPFECLVVLLLHSFGEVSVNRTLASLLFKYYKGIIVPSWNPRCHCRCRIWSKWYRILHSVCSQKPWLFSSLDHLHHREIYSRKKNSWFWCERSPFSLCTRPWTESFSLMPRGLSPTWADLLEKQKLV